MIHPMEAPVFGDVNRKKQRRYSWSAADDEAEETGAVVPKIQGEMSAEMANVLWGTVFQAVFPKTVEDALGILAEATEGLSLNSTHFTPIDPSRRLSDTTKLVSLKLVEAHMSHNSTDTISACTGHQHESKIDQPKALLLRRDETYDLVMIFDRDVSPAADQIEIMVELEDLLFGIPGFNTVTFPVTSRFPDQAPKAVQKNWWATCVGLGDKKATIRLHVSSTARVGKWRMKILTSVKNGDESPKKRDRDMAVAFHRLHIAMSPDQIGRNEKNDSKPRRFSKGSLQSREA